MPSLEQLTSAANPLIKDIRKAGPKGSLTASGHWLAESFHLLEEALRSHSAIAAVPDAQVRPPLEIGRLLLGLAHSFKS